MALQEQQDSTKQNCSAVKLLTYLLLQHFHRTVFFKCNLKQHFKGVRSSGLLYFCSWNLASFGLHTCISIRCHVLTSSQFLCVSLECNVVLLMFITEKTCSQGQVVPNMHKIFVAWAVNLLYPDKRYWQNASKPTETNLSFKSASHCKSIISSWMSTGTSEALSVKGERKIHQRAETFSQTHTAILQSALYTVCINSCCTYLC